jgi:hypothetical protein
MKPLWPVYYIWVQVLSSGVFKKPQTPQMKFGIERSLKMKVVCTWGFDLKVDFDEVIKVTS